MSAQSLGAADPRASVFVMANAGSGKTFTLVQRVARLLVQGTAPDKILCVTYTKAAAAEMQRRLFRLLGEWAVMEDDRLRAALERLDEPAEDLSAARALFARALETPGGLKIQTIHAFCEKLLRRFPLEAGVSPSFTVLEGPAAAEVSAQARERLASVVLARPDSDVARSYAYMAVQLAVRDFEAMLASFEARRRDIKAYDRFCPEGFEADVWRRCGFPQIGSVEAVGQEALAITDWAAWKTAGVALLEGSVTDQELGEALLAVVLEPSFDGAWRAFCTKGGKPRAQLGTKAISGAVRDWLREEQRRIDEACARRRAAVVAEETVHALRIAIAYAALYDGAKDEAGAMDFGDLIFRVHDLLTVRSDAAWVLFKLDGGVDHILLDEAQDTAPEQWAILDRLNREFFAGEGAREQGRTMFAVGDLKQSIYSFQGAAPERFVEEGRRLRSLVTGGGGTFHQYELTDSYRSTPEVLSFVDAVFRDPEAGAGLRPAGSENQEIIHRPRRPAGRGAVDIWPIEVGEPAEPADPWAPVDLKGGESASRKLARRIAAEIKRMVEAGEAVGDQDGARSAAYGDFLILVRRRNALFHEIIRALKKEGVAVGGADRLKLSDHVVFADLLALARFALFAEDDLTLAAILRSPFCDVDEDSLYRLAQPRRASLWAELCARRDEEGAWAAAHDFLTWLGAEAQRRTPFDLYGRILSRLDGAGRTFRSRILTRLGREAEDALDAFLGEALRAEQEGLRDLERFVAAMAMSEIEVKREADEREGRGGGEVRVMTVHGAKGLEAPIVILPDTTTRASVQGVSLLGTADGGFLWAPRKADDCEASAKAREAREKAGADESLRLLYVALTRARDRLIICGVEALERLFKGSWRQIIDRVLAEPTLAPSLRQVAGAGGAQILRYGAEPLLAAATRSQAAPAASQPSWMSQLANPEPARRFASPSQVAETAKGPAPSPLAAVGGLGRYRRGELIHRMLQLLPDIDPGAREDAARRMLERERDLSETQRQEMREAALGVLDDPRFAAVFGPGSRPEVAVAGTAADLPEGLSVSGRVDRLLVTADRVLVVDFKTNRPSPDRPEDADFAYLAQMAVYAAVLREVFPGRAVEAALVWTDGPKLMPLPENLLEATLAQLSAAS